MKNLIISCLLISTLGALSGCASDNRAAMNNSTTLPTQLTPEARASLPPTSPMPAEGSDETVQVVYH